MQAFATSCAGFLLAVLWFDLMFDVQVRRGVTDEAVESIATYYARVTRGASPMNRLVALVMFGLLTALLVEVSSDDVPTVIAVASLALSITAIGLAATHTVPAAVRLGQRVDPPEARRAAAVAIFRQHVLCFTCISIVLVLQLASLA